jgi:hypothetical protein
MTESINSGISLIEFGKTLSKVVYGGYLTLTTLYYMQNTPSNIFIVL